MRKQKGITLISLVITVIVLVILSAVSIYLTLGNNGILNKAEYAKNETTKQTATEKMNLKITTAQINTYTEFQRMPTLEELAITLDADSEIEYVNGSKTVASLADIDFTTAESIFTKLVEFPYEFEINSSLQLASIDGVDVATNDTVTISKDEYNRLKNNVNYSTTEQVIGTWIDGKLVYRKVLSGFSITLTANTWTNICDVSNLNVENLINCTSFAQKNTSIGMGSNGITNAGYQIDSSNYLQLFAHVGWENINTIIIEYTKTTDTATNN